MMRPDFTRIVRNEPGKAPVPALAESRQLLPWDHSQILLPIGNSAEALGLRSTALGYHDGAMPWVVGINTDRAAPHPLRIDWQNGSEVYLELTNRHILDPKEALEATEVDPALSSRSERWLRGISALELQRERRRGAYGQPAVAGLTMLVNERQIEAFLRQQFRAIREGDTDSDPPRSDWERVLQWGMEHASHQIEKPLRIVVLGGGAGSTGNAGLQRVPYIVRKVLREQGVRNYELTAVILGPKAFSGLTPFVESNYNALLQGIDHLMRHGLQGHDGNAPSGGIKVPPYDRILLLDDPMLPSEGPVVTEPELLAFLDRAALSVHAVLNDSAWDTLAGNLVNDEIGLRGLRYLHTAQAAVAGIDTQRLADLLATHLELTIFQGLSQSLAG